MLCQNYYIYETHVQLVEQRVKDWLDITPLHDSENCMF